MRTTPMGRGLGWKKQRIDHRDYRFAARPETLASLPKQIDLRPGMPPVYDQGQLGSCTGNGWAGAFDFERQRQGLPFMTPSRLFIYYNERVLENSVSSDAGAEIRDGAATLAKQGTCSEQELPYDISKFAVKPTKTDYTDALANLAVQYQAVQQTPDQIMGCLAEGYPIVYGFSVFNAYEQIGPSAVVPMPKTREQPLGGHCNVLCGYDDTRTRSTDTLVLSRNSWGTSWGLGGYCWMPMSYLTNQNLASDFWMLQMVSPQPSPTPTPPTPSDTFNVGDGVRSALAAAGLIPASDEQALNANSSKGWLSLTAAADGSVWAYVASLGKVVKVGA